ncbi:MAG: PDZ domain-containing protein [Firmicutes bacterium]|nr:PDZ domain-containing protein [Bacillota bacterium]
MTLLLSPWLWVSVALAAAAPLAFSDASRHLAGVALPSYRRRLLLSIGTGLALGLLGSALLFFTGVTFSRQEALLASSLSVIALLLFGRGGAAVGAWAGACFVWLAHQLPALPAGRSLPNAVIRFLQICDVRALLLLGSIAALCTGCFLVGRRAIWPAQVPGLRGKPVGAHWYAAWLPLPLVALSGGPDLWMAMPMVIGVGGYLTGSHPWRALRRRGYIQFFLGSAMVAVLLLPLPSGALPVLLFLPPLLYAGATRLWKRLEDEEPPFLLPANAGLRIAAVRQGSPAQRLGLRSGDVVLQINGRPVHNREEAMRALSAVPTYAKIVVSHTDSDPTLVQTPVFQRDPPALGLVFLQEEMPIGAWRPVSRWQRPVIFLRRPPYRRRRRPVAFSSEEMAEGSP